MSGLIFHRIGMLVIVPFVWVLASVALILAAPFDAAEMVWTNGIKKHWNDQ